MLITSLPGLFLFQKKIKNKKITAMGNLIKQHFSPGKPGELVKSKEINKIKRRKR